MIELKIRKCDLLSAAEFLSRRNTWTKKAFARAKDGKITRIANKDAVKFDGLGAIGLAIVRRTGREEFGANEFRYSSSIFNEEYMNAIAEFNDAADSRHEVVILLLLLSYTV